jgi:hypothetical protein
MKIIIGFCIFCLVLFLYLHIQFHLKTSQDLEMYEIEQPSKEKLEEICDLRQPILFDFDCQKIVDTTNRDYITNNYHAFEVKIRNTSENDNNTELYIPLPLHSAIKLFNEDKESTYFSENNSDFLDETGVVKSFKYNDDFLRPFMVSNCNYDILMGSTNSYTPFKYEVNYRNYLLLTQGSAQIKLAPPQSKKYLYTNYDYENFEFSSPINPWNPQAKYSPDFDKVKCLEFTLKPGKTLYIPAYWWYSVKMNENTSISCFNYRTYMNNISILPYICLHALQIQNIKRDVVKKVSINKINESYQNNKDYIPKMKHNQYSSKIDNNDDNEDGQNVGDINDIPKPISADDNNIIGSELITELN